MDLESTSSVTSACLSQNDGSLHQNLPSQYFNQPLLLRNALPDGVIRGSDPGNDTRFGANIDGSLGIPVYKRGAVGRSLDITRYSGYDELKRELTRMFSIEGQLEDQQRIGWKLVYVDHENDVLLVGDDPWEEFVSCVRYIRILSPQEVQQMSLDGDLGNSILSNQDLVYLTHWLTFFLECLYCLKECLPPESSYTVLINTFWKNRNQPKQNQERKAKMLVLCHARTQLLAASK
ncbi:hypothetical protein HPP92_018353 [Vanilla planifolia]|uniref:Auxin-responsive protein n=1 Tax=Vanilla planifolia TaxID=51239 RepID=A0A835QDC8_VANPL|nr:hypothetical protein HPP92_018353 [Vanilla planifolia]